MAGLVSVYVCVACTCLCVDPTQSPAGHHNKAKSTLLMETKNGRAEKLIFLSSPSTAGTIIDYLVKQLYFPKCIFVHFSMSSEFD